MVYIHHIFFNYSSLDEHLGYFHVLMTVNSAAMNKGMHASFQIRVLSGYIPKSENAGSYGNSIFHFFKELPYCSPEWLYELTFLPTV